MGGAEKDGVLADGVVEAINALRGAIEAKGGKDSLIIAAEKCESKNADALCDGASHSCRSEGAESGGEESLALAKVAEALSFLLFMPSLSWCRTFAMRMIRLSRCPPLPSLAFGAELCHYVAPSCLHAIRCSRDIAAFVQSPASYALSIPLSAAIDDGAGNPLEQVEALQLIKYWAGDKKTCRNIPIPCVRALSMLAQSRKSYAPVAVKVLSLLGMICPEVVSRADAVKALLYAIQRRTSYTSIAGAALSNILGSLEGRKCGSLELPFALAPLSSPFLDAAVSCAQKGPREEEKKKKEDKLQHQLLPQPELSNQSMTIVDMLRGWGGIFLLSSSSTIGKKGHHPCTLELLCSIFYESRNEDVLREIMGIFIKHTAFEGGRKRKRQGDGRAIDLILSSPLSAVRFAFSLFALYEAKLPRALLRISLRTWLSTQIKDYAVSLLAHYTSLLTSIFPHICIEEELQCREVADMMLAGRMQNENEKAVIRAIGTIGMIDNSILTFSSSSSSVGHQQHMQRAGSAGQLEVERPERKLNHLLKASHVNAHGGSEWRDWDWSAISTITRNHLTHPHSLKRLQGSFLPNLLSFYCSRMTRVRKECDIGIVAASTIVSVASNLLKSPEGIQALANTKIFSIDSADGWTGDVTILEVIAEGLQAEIDAKDGSLAHSKQNSHRRSTITVERVAETRIFHPLTLDETCSGALIDFVGELSGSLEGVSLLNRFGVTSLLKTALNSTSNASLHRMILSSLQLEKSPCPKDFLGMALTNTSIDAFDIALAFSRTMILRSSSSWTEEGEANILVRETEGKNALVVHLSEEEGPPLDKCIEPHRRLVCEEILGTLNIFIQPSSRYKEAQVRKFLEEAVLARPELSEMFARDLGQRLSFDFVQGSKSACGPGDTATCPIPLAILGTTIGYPKLVASDWFMDSMSWWKSGWKVYGCRAMSIIARSSVVQADECDNVSTQNLSGDMASSSMPFLHLPLHFYGQLAKTSPGCIMLEGAAEEELKQILLTVTGPLIDVSETISAIFAIGHISSCETGSDLPGVGDAVRQLCHLGISSSNITLKSACIISLSLATVCRSSRLVMSECGWQCNVVHRVGKPYGVATHPEIFTCAALPSHRLVTRVEEFVGEWRKRKQASAPNLSSGDKKRKGGEKLWGNGLKSPPPPPLTDVGIQALKHIIELQNPVLNDDATENLKALCQSQGNALRADNQLKVEVSLHLSKYVIPHDKRKALWEMLGY